MRFTVEIGRRPVTSRMIFFPSMLAKARAASEMAEADWAANIDCSTALNDSRKVARPDSSFEMTTFSFGVVSAVCDGRTSCCNGDVISFAVPRRATDDTTS